MKLWSARRKKIPRKRNKKTERKLKDIILHFDIEADCCNCITICNFIFFSKLSA